MSTPTPSRRPIVVPPRPDTPPAVGPEMPVPPSAPRSAASGVQSGPDAGASTRRERSAARRQAVSRTTHRERHKTRQRTVNVNITKNFGSNAGAGVVGAAGGAASGAAGSAGKVPGADFMSNEDIRAFAEHLRKQGRNRAVERSLDAEHLFQVLKHIPDANGSKAGSRARARRVSRHLRMIAAAERIIARQAAGLWRSFEQEYDSELSKIGKGRQQRGKGGPKQPFRFS